MSARVYTCSPTRPAPWTNCGGCGLASWIRSRSAQNWVLEEGSKMHDRTTTHHDAPVHNPMGAEIEVTDPGHPLFSRRFRVVSVTRSPRTQGHVYVAYRGCMQLMIPILATSLRP